MHLRTSTYRGFILPVALLLTVAVLTISCKKDFLDTIPRNDIDVPSTLGDMQTLLDNYSIMNQTPKLGETSADNYFLPDGTLSGIFQIAERNSYTWEKDIFEDQGNNPDWNNSYTQVLYANVILEALPAIEVTADNQVEWNRLKGCALFARAHAFYQLSQVFAPPYTETSANSDAGLPLKLSADINETITRASVKATYNRILADLKEASPLLPADVPADNRNRASRPAALALLARVYLSMRDYEKAGLYADSCLQLYSSLIDFNALTATTVPFGKNNIETIFQSRTLSPTSILGSITTPQCKVDTVLYNSYATNDLRRSIYYTTPSSDGTCNIRGSHSGSVYPFTGLSTDEQYLIRAEAFARAGKTNEAMTDLNTLLASRWKTGTFTPYTVEDESDALDLILQERRKELAFRGIRWSDLRRLNQEEGRTITLKRKIADSVYLLLPKSALYTLPIPPDVIKASGIPQNER